MNHRRLHVLAVALLLIGSLASSAVAQWRERRERDDRYDRRDRRDRYDRHDWEELGCQKVSFRVDHDVVHVGRHEGRFKAIRVYARGGDVEMLDLRVIYGDGEPDDLPVRQILRRGDRSRPLDLRGWQRSIHRIEMVYRALPNYRGRDALVCVDGLSG